LYAGIGFRNAGGRLIDTYHTFGKYDGVSIAEAPNDEALMSCLLSIGSQGNASTVILKPLVILRLLK
jgi:uncharacterized protein with GYD domain